MHICLLFCNFSVDQNPVFTRITESFNTEEEVILVRYIFIYPKEQEVATNDIVFLQ